MADKAALKSNVIPLRIASGIRPSPQQPPTLHAPAVAVFISCSDSRRDILERVLPSVFKFWPDCPYPIYVGMNSPLGQWPQARTLVAEPRGWRRECLDQVVNIPASHLIVLLDDFLFEGHVDQSKVSRLVAKVTQSNISYLRLSPLGKSLKRRMAGRRQPGVEEFQAIEDGRPFYSCLQIALWKKQHFISMLGLRGSVWDFEHQRQPDVVHFAITGRSPFEYRHIVEKGRWLPYADSLLRSAGLPADLGTRPSWTRWRNLRLFLEKVRFFLLGYANY